ncbi:MAG: hypothetical protein CBE09_03880 [Rhizobiales bacterium TMED249]|nr:MAG: hypothetical protein CBE09_03880 [Rhizobiales bacterium TMED249]|tara:strand:+ start:2193 stop:2810 length:618 start_codon:yes stop_codon:yes gene_type:complete
MIAIPLYPGGNMLDSSQIGYDFSRNYLSELGGYKAQSGETNFFSAFFFNIGVFAFILVGVSFFFIPKLFVNHRFAYMCALIGSILMVMGCLLFAAVGLTPYDLYLKAHLFVTQNAFRLIVPATLFYLIALYLVNIPKVYLSIGYIFFVSNILYVIYQFLFENPQAGENSLIEGVIIQKIIIALCMLNIFSFSFAFAKLSEDNFSR